MVPTDPANPEIHDPNETYTEDESNTPEDDNQGGTPPPVDDETAGSLDAASDSHG